MMKVELFLSRRKLLGRNSAHLDHAASCHAFQVSVMDALRRIWPLAELHVEWSDRGVHSVELSDWPAGSPDEASAPQDIIDMVDALRATARWPRYIG